MSSNIYESFSIDYRDGGQREERMVDIYDSVGTSTGCRVLPETGSAAAANQRPPPDVQKKLLRAAVVVLGLLCVLLGVGLAVLWAHRASDPSCEQVKASHHLLSRDDCNREAFENGKRGNVSERRVKTFCYYMSTEEKNWTESRADCLSRGADLVIITTKEKQEFLSSLTRPETFWIGLQTKKLSYDKWEWTWVDGTPFSYRAFKHDVPVTDPSETSRGFMGPQGLWNRTNGGSKRFICEKTLQ